MKLINFVENNINILSDIDLDNKYIISIVGDARKGKSTFLNLIINYLTKENKEYFKMDDGLSHCTLGIDY
jgi:ABC-type thiamine transport system ATPase subunit